MQVVNRSGSKLADEIAKEIKFMTDKRVNALKVSKTHLIIVP